MKVLTIDKGNTNCKFAIFEDGRLDRRGIRNDMEELEVLIWEIRPDMVSFSSVVPEWSRDIKKRLDISGFPYKEMSSDVKLPFKLLVDEPRRLGPDRIALACGARYLGFDRAVIVDAGTALTVDLLSENGFEGGAIFPGPELLIKALSTGTALIGNVEFSDKVPVLPARNTSDAVRAGSFWGFIGAVNSLVLSMVSKIDGMIGWDKKAVLISGGHAGWVVEHLEPEIKKLADIEKDLIFYGLYSILHIDS